MLMKLSTTQKEIFMTNYVTLFNDLTIDRYSTNSEWETVKETFLHNLRTTIQCIRSGKAQKAPFVRMRRRMLQAVRGHMKDGKPPLGLNDDIPYDRLRAEEAIISRDTTWKEVCKLGQS